MTLRYAHNCKNHKNQDTAPANLHPQRDFDSLCIQLLISAWGATWPEIEEGLLNERQNELEL